MKMKTLILVFFACVLLVGCKEITVTTTVKENGSCERMVQVKGDSTDILHSSFPIPMDETWSVGWEKDEEKKNDIYTARKSARRIEDLIVKPGKDSEMRVSVETGLKRGFRWFYTVYRFTEVYKAYSPFELSPVPFFSEEELESLNSGVEIDSLDQKFGDWVTRAFLEGMIRGLMDGAEAEADLALTPARIAERKSELLKAMEDIDADDPEEIRKQFLSLCQRIFKSNAVWRLESHLKSVTLELWKKHEFLNNIQGDTIVNRVVMPGLIVDTNGNVQGNMVEWKLEWIRFCYKDFSMSVVSRSVHVWAYLVLAVFLALGTAAILWVRRSPR